MTFDQVKAIGTSQDKVQEEIERNNAGSQDLSRRLWQEPNTLQGSNTRSTGEQPNALGGSSLDFNTHNLYGFTEDVRLGASVPTPAGDRFGLKDAPTSNDKAKHSSDDSGVIRPDPREWQGFPQAPGRKSPVIDNGGLRPDKTQEKDSRKEPDQPRTQAVGDPKDLILRQQERQEQHKSPLGKPTYRGRVGDTDHFDYPDGTQVDVSTKTGRRTAHYPDGTAEVSDKTCKIIQPRQKPPIAGKEGGHLDGRVGDTEYWSYPDGVQVDVNKKDGSKTVHYPDGTSETKDKDGKTVKEREMSPIAGKEGGRLVGHFGDKDFWEYPDETQVDVDRKTGQITIHHPDGTTEILETDDTQVKEQKLPPEAGEEGDDWVDGADVDPGR